MSPDMPWPKDVPVFHLLTGDGLFLCRNHTFFRSSVPVTGGPSELANHKAFASIDFPKIPQRMFERITGFFYLAGERYSAEAAVLLAWNRKTFAVELVVPNQCALVGTDGRGGSYPLTVTYDVPALPADLILFGDVHSHVEGPAYASTMDVHDELERPGLHIVVGRTHLDPPDLHIEITVDGTRFTVGNPDDVIDGYDARRTDEVPAEWFDRLSIKRQAPYIYSSPPIAYPPAVRRPGEWTPN